MIRAATVEQKRLDFRYLPEYAAFLREHKLADLIREQLRLSREMKLPMLRFFEHIPDEQLVEISKPSHAEFLTYLVENRADEQIEKAIDEFVSNKISGLDHSNVAVEDIALTGYLRKSSFLKFLPEYTTHTDEIIGIVQEIDAFNIATDVAASKAFVGLLTGRLNQREAQLLEAQQIASVGSFVWDLRTKRSSVTPQLLTILNLSNPDDFNGFIANIHPDDRQKVQAAIERALDSDHGVYDCEYRYIIPGREKIIWSHGLVTFQNGQPLSMSGTVMDVTERNHLTERLKESESLYKQAEALTHIGNWTWDIADNRVAWSDEMYRIYGFAPQSEIVSFERFIGLVHPDDRELVISRVQGSLHTHQPNDFYHRIVLDDGTEKVLHAKGRVLLNDDGKPIRMLGTGQDVTERQRLLERLQTSKDLYKQAQALAHIGNWTWEVATNDVTWSDELYRIHNLEPRSVLPSFELALSFVHPDDREKLRDGIRNSLKTLTPGEIYYRLQVPGGDEKMIHGKCEVLADAHGWVYRVTGTAQDVTTQHRIEQQLRENQTFTQKIADATPSIIATYNINTGVYKYVSEGLRKLLGYESTLPMERGVAFFMELMHPDDIGPTMEKNVAALQHANALGDTDQDPIVDFMYRMKHKNGQYRWFHTYGTVFDRNEQGLVEHVLNITLDITERIQAERNVAEREEFIRHIADASPTVLYLFDLNEARVTYINNEITPALGYTPEEIVAMGNLFTPTLYHPEDIVKSPEEYGGYRSAHAAQPIMEYECRMKHKDGEWRWMLVREMIYQRGADGRPASVLGAALDITDRKEMEDTLVRRTTELQQTNANLAEFAYVASHDLKEPLRKIQVFADRIAAKEADRLSDSGKDWFRRMQSAATRMDDLIDDLLSFSRTNTGEKNLNDVNLNALLETVKSDLSEPIEQSKAAIKSAALPSVPGVEIQLRQLFQNLLSNAIKFRKPNEAPKIVLENELVAGIELTRFSAEKNKRYLQLKFIDNGIGFEPEYAEKIFGLFQRLHGKTEYPGTGIGLALCKKVVENHNGFIEAESEPGNGATFTVYLPLT